MELTSTSEQRPGFPSDTPRHEAYASGVSWAAVIAGSAVAAALSLILLALGTGLGLSSVSPWSDTGVSASKVGGAAVVWLILMQVISSSMGGYLAGRLRTKWATIHTDEVYFRDTAHGFLVWAVSLVVTAAFLTSAAMSMLGAVSRRGDAAERPQHTGNAYDDGQALDNVSYFVDRLLRSEHPSLDGNSDSFRAETGRLFSHALLKKDAPNSDETYLAQLVATKTGLNLVEAQKRVSEVLEEARQEEEETRKAVAHLSLWMFVALLGGAFCASYAATIGGRQRDHVKLV